MLTEANHVIRMRRVVGRSVHFFLVSDPGLIRLRSAATTTVCFVAALGVLLFVTHRLNQPVTVAMMGTVVALFSSFVVKDPDKRSILITTALVPLPATAALSIAALLSGYGKVADVGFIVILFIAVWVRRFGPRGFALGMTAFISYFYVIALHANATEIPILTLSVTIGVATTFIVKAIVLRQGPRHELVELDHALRVEAASLLSNAYRPHDLPGYDKTMRQSLDRLANTALMIEDWVDRNGDITSSGGVDTLLSRQVFDAQQATEQLAYSLASLDPRVVRSGELDTDIDAVLTALRTLVSSAESNTGIAAGGSSIDEPVGNRAVAKHYAYRTFEAFSVLRDSIVRGRFAAAPARELPDAGATDGATSAERKNVVPSTRAAIQVAVAASAATIAGEILSPNRWYWAVLAAFVVFTGTTTRGEILTRGSRRVIGTVAGVFAGVLLAAVVGHRPDVQMTLIVVCVFWAYYLRTVANATKVFFTTVLMAMMYGLLDKFSVEVLEIRVKETVAGAVIGIASAYFILPVRTRKTLIEDVDTYLEMLEGLIGDCVDSMVKGQNAKDLVAGARDLDIALKSAVQAGKPLRLQPTARARRGTARMIRILEECDRAVRDLVRAATVEAETNTHTARSERSAPSAIHLRSLDDAAAVVRESVQDLRNTIDGRRSSSVRVTSASDDKLFLIDEDQFAEGPWRAAARALNQLSRATQLVRLPL